MFKNIIIGILLFILIVLMVIIYFARPNVMSVYPLKDKEIKKVIKLANEGNVTAMTQLMVHFKTIDNLDKSQYWKNKVDKFYNFSDKK